MMVGPADRPRAPPRTVVDSQPGDPRILKLAVRVVSSAL